MHSPRGFCTALPYATVCSFRLGSWHVNKTLWLRWCLNLHQGSTFAKPHFGWALGPCLNPALRSLPLYSWQQDPRVLTSSPPQKRSCETGASSLQGENTSGKSLTTCLWGKWLFALCLQKHTTANPKGPLLMHGFWVCCWTWCSQGSSASPALQSEPYTPSPKGKLDPPGEINASLSSASAHTIPGAQLRAHVTPPGRHKPCLSCLKCWTPTPPLLHPFSSVR